MQIDIKNAVVEKESVKQGEKVKNKKTIIFTNQNCQK